MIEVLVTSKVDNYHLTVERDSTYPALGYTYSVWIFRHDTRHIWAGIHTFEQIPTRTQLHQLATISLKHLQAKLTMLIDFMPIATMIPDDSLEER
jgi:hypothetical protein